MGKKAHKKIRDLQRLQSLYGTVAAPTNESMAMNREETVQRPTPTIGSPQSVVVHHTHAAEVVRDLKGLVIIMALMVGLLLVMNWLVGSTNLEESLINFGRNIT